MINVIRKSSETYYWVLKLSDGRICKINCSTPICLTKCMIFFSQKKHWLSSHSYVFSHHLLFFRHFRYSLTNCLFAATYDKVLEKCHCVPFFHTMAYEDYPRICAGPELLCMNTILRDIGSHTRVRTEDEAGNVKWKPCLFACRYLRLTILRCV